MKRKNIIFYMFTFMFLVLFSHCSIQVAAYDSEEEAIQYMRKEMIKRRKRIDIELDKPATVEIAKEIYEKVFEYTGNPKEGDYLAYNTYYPHQSLDITINGNSITFKNLKYITSQQQEEVVDQKVADILAELNLSNKDDYEKIQLIHKWLVDHIEYMENSITNVGSAYKALVDGKSSCRGYALSFVRLCAEVGIESRFVYRDTEEHEWNLVKLDGKWYHDDSCGSDYEGRPYLCFLKGTVWWKNTGLPLHERFSSYNIEPNDYVAVGKPVFSSLKDQGGSIVINWKPVKHAVGYRLYRKKNNGSYALIKNLTELTYTDSDISYGNEYLYKVSAYDLCGREGSASSVKKIVHLLPPKGITLKAGSKKLTLKMKKASGSSGYQIQYSLKKSMKSAKTLNTKKLSNTISKLKKSKIYYVRVRSYKTISGKKIYSAWSKIYSKKTKK